jgi:Putative beta-barrel porin-2, OmpL-like. bbp2
LARSSFYPEFRKMNRFLMSSSCVAFVLGAAGAFAQTPPPAPAAPAPAPAPAAEPAPAPAAAPAAAAPAPVKYPTTTFSGYVEGAYHRTLGDTDYRLVLPTRAYDTANGFQLHAAHLVLKHAQTEHVNAEIDFDAGSDAAVNNFTAGTPSAQLFDVPQAFVSYSNSGVTFTAGKFATYEGIEVFQGPSNPTITRGFLYFLAEPVTHVGAKLHYASGPIDVGVGLVNGWDTNGRFYTADNNDMKTSIFRVGLTPSPMFWAALSGTYGVEKPGGTSDPRLSVDLTGAVIPNDKVTINFQANFGSEKAAGLPDPMTMAPTDASWFGIGIQPVLKMDAASIGARFEYFKDTKGSRTLVANDPSYMNFTITPGYTFDGAFTVRAEFRYDTCSEEVLGVLTPTSPLKKNQSTIALGAHYTF